MPYWRLYYKNGTYRDERPEEESLRAAPVGAQVLAVCIAQGELRRPLLQIDIPSSYKPIWYRRKSVSSNNAGAVPQTDAVILGSAREGANGYEGNLYAVIQGKIIDCPPNMIDYGAITSLLRV